MALQMIGVRARYLFPEGSVVDTANPAVRRTIATMGYEWELRRIVEAASRWHSLFIFISVRLPPARPRRASHPASTGLRLDVCRRCRRTTMLG